MKHKDVFTFLAVAVVSISAALAYSHIESTSDDTVKAIASSLESMSSTNAAACEAKTPDCRPVQNCADVASLGGILVVGDKQINIQPSEIHDKTGMCEVALTVDGQSSKASFTATRASAE